MDDVTLQNEPHRSIKERILSTDLRTSIILYILFSLVAAFAVSTILTNLSGYFRWKLRLKYEGEATHYSVPAGGSVVMSYDAQNTYYIITDENHNVVNEITVNYEEAEPYYDYNTPIDNYIPNYIIRFENLARLNRYSQPTSDVTSIVVVPAYSSFDRALDFLLSVINIVATPLLFAASTIVCILLFYRHRLRKPITLLENASEKIANNDLDFSISYPREDEMGRLCEAFETMRLQLSENHRYIWQQIEERKQLNAAFSHDLRTPLTVLKGHTSMILSAANDGSMTKADIADEATTMSKHIQRMENYVNAMNRLQRLEDLEIHCKAIRLGDLIKQLEDTAKILIHDKHLRFLPDLEPNAHLMLDDEIIMQVYENLISNAVRFAESSVTVLITSTDHSLSITVSDDGKGFTERDLSLATKPFYRAGSNEDTHLGLGLHICRVLCEQHNGFLHLKNGRTGGGEITAIFSTL